MGPATHPAAWSRCPLGHGGRRRAAWQAQPGQGFPCLHQAETAPCSCIPSPPTQDAAFYLEGSLVPRINLAIGASCLALVATTLLAFLRRVIRSNLSGKRW